LKIILVVSLVDDLAIINNITSLKTLVLSNNPLATIPELTLPNLVNLELENTNLKNATFPKSYGNCTNLQSIVLSNNKLTEITSEDFKSLISLTKISIDNAELIAIEPYTFINLTKTLQSISLVSNSLKSTEFLSSLTSLLSVNLDQNKFTRLPNELLKPDLTKHFFFRDNQIEIIDELSPLFYWMKTNITDIEIYLNNNPFDCCQSRWFIRYLTGPNNLVKDSVNLTCALPKAYTGQRLIDLHADLMDCSDGPFHPPKHHLNKTAIITLSLIAVAMLILVVVGISLHRRDRLYFGRRQAYEPIAGDNLSA
jgi:hypothetical protein